MFERFVKSLVLKKQAVFWSFFFIATFLVGYFFRSYYSIFKYLPHSPYDLFFETNLFGKNLGLDIFSIKVLNYPLGYYLSLVSQTHFRNVYLTYFFGSLIFFFFGRELSGRKMGGVLAVIGFAVGYENLIQYTGITYPSGLSYVLIITSLYFLYKYFITSRSFWLCLFWLSGVAVLLTYHTGAGAFCLILLGIFISFLISPNPLSKKLVGSFLALWIVYLLILILMDPLQLQLVSDSFSALKPLPILTSLLLIGAGIIALATIIKLNLDKKFLLPLSIIGSFILVFLPVNIFQPLLKLGTVNYFSSVTTLNNYLAQAILFHVYLLLFLRNLLLVNTDRKKIFLRGWLVGLLLIFVVFSLVEYHVRVLDYSFPLMFLFFGWYWSGRSKRRALVVFATVSILIISQFKIFSDPFSARRYYAPEEVRSAETIIGLNLDGVLLSDLRTAALFEYLGENGVLFFNSDSKEHNWLFYEPEKIKEYQFPGQLKKTRSGLYAYEIPNYYFILSQKMKDFVYSTNFQTKPIKQELFNFFDEHYKAVYTDDLMTVYLIRPRYVDKDSNPIIKVL